MNTNHIVSQIQEYIDGELSAEARVEFERHIAECAACSEEFHAMRDLVHKIGGLPRTIQPPPGFMEELDLRLPLKPEKIFNLEHRSNGVASANAAARGTRTTWRVYYAIAAAVVLIGASVMIWQRMHRPAELKVVMVDRGKPAPQKLQMPSAVQQPQPEPKSFAARGNEDRSAKQTSILAGAQAPALAQNGSAAGVVPPHVQVESVPLAALSSAKASAGTGDISGVVTDSSGQPVANAHVRLVGKGFHVLTDANGKYRISGVPAGKATLDIRLNDYQTKDFASFEIKPGRVNTQDVVLGPPQAVVQPPPPPTGGIMGHVTNKQGWPVIGATVSIAGTNFQTTTETGGWYQFAGITPGRYTLIFSGVHWAVDSLVNVRVEANTTIDASTSLVQLPSKPLAENDQPQVNSNSVTERNMQPQISPSGGTGTIIGRVLDEKGQPLAGAVVTVVGTTRGAQTDIDGKYRIVGVPAGTVTLKFSFVGLNTVNIDNVRVGANETTSRDGQLKPAPITSVGIVAEAAGGNPNSNAAGVAAPKQQAKQSLNMTGGNDAPAPGVTSSGGSRAFTNSLHPWHSVPQRGNTEEYQPYTENEYFHVNRDALSTFSIDVDGGSYSNVRRFINQASLPPVDAVRTQELINYFAYDYPQPTHGDPISVTTEIAACPWNPQHQIALIGLQARKVSRNDMPASNLVFLIDVSGSMAEPNKLPLVKAAFELLVDHLRSEDRVSIVTYAGNAQTALYPTPGDQKRQILNAIDGLYASGGTNGGEGLMHAYDLAKQNYIAEGNNRVILATDGDFNVGVSSDAELGKLIESRRDDGIYLTVLGFGMGNYKDAKMKMLADKGQGNQYYIDNMPEAEKVFSTQLTSTLFAIANDVKAQVEFNPYNVRMYRLIGYESRMLNKEDFNDDSKDAGEMGAGHQVTALYEIVPANGEPEPSPVDALKYQDEEAREAAAPRYTDEAFTVKIRYKNPYGGDQSLLITHTQKQSDESFERGSNNLRWAAVVAEFGMSLRNSKFKGSSTFGAALRLARELHMDDPNGDRAEFLRLLKTCQLLAHERDE